MDSPIDDEPGWWLISNRHGGIHRASGRTAADAKTEVRRNIAQAFAEEGLSPAACGRAAYSYNVRVVAGPITYGQARNAMAAWDCGDFEPAAQLANPRVRRRLIGDD